MKNGKNIIALVLALVVCLGMFAGCAGGNSNAKDISYIKGKGTLIVGITDFAPMDYKDDNGNWIGFDAEMATKVAEALGVKVQFVEIDWDNKIMELNSKSIDCVWNGMTLTDEVVKSMSCTRAYCNNAQVVVVPAAAAGQYGQDASLSDLNFSGLRFAVEAGSAGEGAAKELGYQYTAVNTQADALMEVASGASDACIIDRLMAGAMIGEGTSYPNMSLVVNLNNEEYGAGCRKGSDLTAFINDTMKKLYADGTMQSLAQKYGVQEALIAQ